MSAIDLSSWIWVGPATEEALQADFGMFFFKVVTAQGDVFINPNDADEVQLRMNLGKNRGLQLSPDQARAIDVVKLLPPRERSDFQKYLSDAQEFLKDSGHKSCLCDLSQSHGVRSRMSKFMPTLMTSTRLFSFSAKCFVTHAGMEASLGYPIPGTAEYQMYQADFGHGPLDGLSDSARQCLNGNAMHLHCVAAWHAYILSNLVKRDVVEPPKTIEENCASADEDGDAMPNKRPKLRSACSTTFTFSEAGIARGRTFDYGEQ